MTSRRLLFIMSFVMLAVGPMLLLLYLADPVTGVEQYGYRVLYKKPQHRRLYVQGLEIHDDHLYVSGGLYGESSLERYAFDTMTLETERQLDARLFAEGLTVFDDRVYLLTWRAQQMLVFDRKKLELLESFPIAGQGWGLTNDGKRLIYSDGSDQLYFLAPQTRFVERSLKVTENGQPVHRLNELEWVEGEIWANIYQTDRVVVIDPTSGEVLRQHRSLRPSAARRAQAGYLRAQRHCARPHGRCHLGHRQALALAVSH